MLYNNITKIKNDRLVQIKERCSQFINNEQVPLYKTLHLHDDIVKVKIRKKRVNCDSDEVLNHTFEHLTYDIRQRSLLCNVSPTPSLVLPELFYIFPIDGYKTLFNKSISHAESIVLDLSNQVTNYDLRIVPDVLRFSYSTGTLPEAINHPYEVMVFNIPYFYAVRVEAFESYKSLIDSIRSK